MKYLITEKQLKTLRKYMKTFINEKQDLDEVNLKNIGAGLALTAASLGSPNLKAQNYDYVKPPTQINYADDMDDYKIKNDTLYINTGKELDEVLEHFYNNFELSDVFIDFNLLSNSNEQIEKKIKHYILKYNRDFPYGNFSNIIINQNALEQFINSVKQGRKTRFFINRGKLDYRG